jgi:hypothetical protein
MIKGENGGENVKNKRVKELKIRSVSIEEGEEVDDDEKVAQYPHTDIAIENLRHHPSKRDSSGTATSSTARKAKTQSMGMIYIFQPLTTEEYEASNCSDDNVQGTSSDLHILTTTYLN